MIEIGVSLFFILIAFVFGSEKNKEDGSVSYEKTKKLSPIKCDQYYSNQCDLDDPYSISYTERKRREQTPVSFSDGLSFETFKKIANAAAEKIKRIEDIRVHDDGTIYCDVRSNSGLSTWFFSLDFNEWGHITGGYWSFQDNDDSTVPDHVGQTISGMINTYYESIGVTFPDYSSFARSAYEKAPKNNGLFKGIEELIKRTYSRNNSVGFSSSEMLNEHMDVVVGMLKSDGFYNILLTPYPDVDGNNIFYEKQVFYVSIDGNNHFSGTDCFPRNALVEIHFHDKKSIFISRSQIKAYKKMNYEAALEQLATLGFKELYSIERNDLYIGLLKKKDSIKDIHIENEKGEFSVLVGDAEYLYDRKIVVEYHAYKPFMKRL